jgi:hypothetical protein
LNCEPIQRQRLDHTISGPKSIQGLEQHGSVAPRTSPIWCQFDAISRPRNYNPHTMQPHDKMAGKSFLSDDLLEYF